MVAQSQVIGRIREKAELDRAISSGQPELVAIYGRRRVGKTYLIREYLNDRLVFELSGLHNQTLSRQLENFALRFSEVGGTTDERPKSWLAAFTMLRRYLSKRRSKQKYVLFFDEFPWLATRRSGFVAAFEEFWNSFGSRDKRMVCVICGSAASWMIKNIVNSKGGLHNRTTSSIRLEPFSLAETKKFLLSRGIKLNDFQVAQLYMAVGGIPHYLQQIKKGKSAAQNIDELCFKKDGPLTREFANLYAALFEKPDRHEVIVRTLAKKQQGMTRTELADLAGLDSGGSLTRTLTELIESGFVCEMPALFARRKNSLLRLVDPFTLFYLKWIEPNRMSGQNIWLTKSAGQKWRSWCGYAFENLCMSHIAQIKSSLGIAGVLTEEASWHYRAKSKSEDGAQIDLLIDRNDQCINICEMKFTESPFSVDKRYARDLLRKTDVFRLRSKTAKTIFTTLVTANGLKQNEYSNELVASEVTLADLFLS